MNKILLGNSYKLIKEIPDKSIDLIITDPPYLIKNTKAGKKSALGRSIQKMNDELANGEFTKSINEEILDDFVRVMKKINIYIWCNHKQIPMYINYFVNKLGCKFDILIWNKTNATPLFNNKYLTDKEYCLYFRKGGFCNPANYEDAKTVFRQPINKKDKDLYGHPTIKPLNIIKALVRNSSKENEVILDAFSGSGTTAVACKELNRKFIGFEIDPEFHKKSLERLRNATVEEKINEKNGIAVSSLFDLEE